MAKIHSMMDIGKRAMMNSQTSLQTVAHNIANKSTEGFSRQRVDQVTAPPIVEGRLQMGMGSRAAQVTRIGNPFIEKQLQAATGNMGQATAHSEGMARVEQVFNEQQNKALNSYISDFFNAFRELSNNPESTTIRTIVKETGEALTKDFQRVDSQLTGVQRDIDFQIKARTEEINNMTKEIASLNKEISQVEVQGTPANDQQDRRDLLIKKLNEIVDIRVADGENGLISVSTAGNALLVSGLDYMKLENGVDNKGRVSLLAQTSANHLTNDITHRIKGGTLGGLVEVRDHVVDGLKDQMDGLAYRIGNEVNEAHQLGFDRGGRQGVQFFEPLADSKEASKFLKVNDAILNDVSRIAAGAKPNAPGDNTVANVISQIQYKQNMEDGTSTMDDYYNSIVGKLGVQAAQSNKLRESQGNILQQINTLRESVSGVSLDEEATKMIEFQKTFDASARLIKTADEMFDTVLSLKRM